MMKSDVVIVGAGISGLWLAHELNKSLSVTVLEKEAFPATKICGNVMSPVAYSLISHLDPPDTIFNEPKTMDLKINSSFMLSGFYNLNREEFYKWLNIDVLDRTTIRSIHKENGSFMLDTNRGAIETEFLVGADGIFSRVRRLFTEKRVNLIHTMQYLMKTDKQIDSFDMIFDPNLSSDYYVWVIPKNNNVLIGTSLNDRNKLLDFAAKNYNTTDIIKRESFPITKIKSTDEIFIGEDNLMLIGEAAGFVRPKTGEGINFALRSAEFAAKSINESTNYKNLCEPIILELNRELNSPSSF